MQTTIAQLNDRALRIFQNVTDQTPIEVEAIRSWLSDAAEHGSAAPLLLLYLWGTLVRTLLETTGRTQTIQASDGRLVADYFRTIERKSMAEILTDEAPPKQHYDNGFSLGYPIRTWDGRPLYANTREVLTLLKTERSIPIVGNLFVSQQWRGEDLLRLLAECDAYMGDKNSPLGTRSNAPSGYLAMSKTLFMEGAANALVHSPWCPTEQERSFYREAWHFALQSSTMASVESNLARVEALKIKLPHLPGNQLWGLSLNPKRSFDEVNALFPLEVEHLGTPKNLKLLISLHAQQDKAPVFGHAVGLFKEHHPELSSLIETHLVLHSEEAPVEHLVEAWTNVVHRVQPETYSVAGLVV